MTLTTFIILALATYRLTRLVTTDTFPPILRAREWLLRRWPSEDTLFTLAEVKKLDRSGVTYYEHWETGIGLFKDGDLYKPSAPHWFGELISCNYCASVWVGFGVLALYSLWPGFVWVATALALAGVGGLVASRG